MYGATGVYVGELGNENYSHFISPNKKLPYLNQEIMDAFSYVRIKSEDGHEILINNLILIAWSDFSKDLLEDLKNEDIVISTNFTFEELKFFNDFIMKGFFRRPYSSTILAARRGPRGTVGVD